MIPLQDNVPLERSAVVNWALIIINVIVFIFELSLGYHLQSFVQQWAVVPHRFLSHPVGEHEIATIFAGMFMHGGWLHLIGNMWALLIFGDNVENSMGHVRYLFFYLMAGIAASLVQILSAASTGIPELGASGAIAGVMAAFLVFYPHARVNTWFGGFFIFMLPAWFVVGEWFVVQLINGFSVVAQNPPQGGTAWFAHVGGFIFGLLFAQLFQSSKGGPPYLYRQKNTEKRTGEYRQYR